MEESGRQIVGGSGAIAGNERRVETEALEVARYPLTAYRVDIERDLIALHRPLLNDLLRSRQPAEIS